MSHSVQSDKPNISSSAAAWAVLIFVGLIIAAINFVQAESTGEGHGEHATEQHHGGHEGQEAATHEAAAEATAPGAHDAPAAADSNAHGEQHEAPAAGHEEQHH